MNFYSLIFAIFLLISLVMYYSLFRKYQWIWLLIVSIAFYAYSGVFNLIFIVITAASTFVGGFLIQKSVDKYAVVAKDKSIPREEKRSIRKSSEQYRRFVLWTVLVINFGMLALLKYWNPFAKGFLLPLGISFYIFISISYLIDVYNEKYDAEQNFFKFFLFVSFFPQLIQGPINRFDHMKEQLYARHRIEWERWKRACLLILFGAVKKYAIANLLSNFIAQILDNPDVNTPGSAILLGILLYSAQQYADFSGGIDMVLGIAQLFGIDMMQNFRQPYFSVSLGDFWRRWHISLGACMKDYVFYPIALTKPMQKLSKWANKHMSPHFGRVLPASIANILVFFLVGLWHGAQWHFIFWGLYNGIVIAISDICAPAFGKLAKCLHINVDSKGHKVFRIVRTFIIVNIGWYFDRIYKIEDCFISMKNTILNFKIGQLREYVEPLFFVVPRKAMIVAGIATIIVFINSIIKESGKDTILLLERWPIALRWTVYYVLMFIVLISFSFSVGAGGFMYANY